MTIVKYLKKDVGRLYKNETTNNVFTELLWGDRIEVLSSAAVNGRLEANARGYKRGFVKESDLGDNPLLELYFIDVGQGDGMLIVTPDRRHIVIDGGYNRKAQSHGKSAADFIDWKFKKDYGLDTIHIDCMISSHCDLDHYGGLWDLVNPDEKSDLDCKATEIDEFYHAGVSWWMPKGGKRFLGKSKDGYLIDLLDTESSVRLGLDPLSELQLQGNWALFLKCILDSGARINRLAHDPDEQIPYLQGFGQGSKPEIKIMGPIQYTLDGKPVLKDFGSESQNTNGNSILLRVDYDHVRILLTGDLNKKSQQQILEILGANKTELAADVSKACYHGSDDCSFEFINCIKASTSIISSGDDETHGHPRPNIVAACGIGGYLNIRDDEIITPLIFSTEISRSLRIGDPQSVEFKNYKYGDEKIDVLLTDESKTRVAYKRTTSGALNPKKMIKPMERLKVVDGLVYGLVNVRTDGKKVLCATLNEGKSTWSIKKFSARF
jgi:hypothetical protein